MPEPKLRGNIGEWSEIYVFLRLLANGKLDVADETLKAVPNEFYKILAIIRKEAQSENEFLRYDDYINIKVKNDVTGDMETFSMSVGRFAENADRLLLNIKHNFNYIQPEIENFLAELKVYSIKDVGHKRDITITIEDFHNGMAQTLGFSIKSFLGARSTLFNPGAGTNFIYRIDFPEGMDVDCDEFNASTYEGKPNKIAYRLEEIARRGGAITFSHVQSDCLSQNLRTIDGDLPFILSQLLLIKYRLNRGTWKKFIEVLTEENPLGFRIDEHGQVYEYKVKRFLQDCAMGMTPEKPWTGFYDATGGQIIVKKDGDIVCYHVYELNRFLQYLLDGTKLEQASTSEDSNMPGHVRMPSSGSRPKPYQFGWLYKEDGKYYFKINLQVRFK